MLRPKPLLVLSALSVVGWGLECVGFWLVLGGFAAWVTHIVTCFQHDEWGFLLVGALFFPIAVIHGIGVWFGFWN